MEKSGEVLSSWVQQANGFSVETLPDSNRSGSASFGEALHHNTKTRIPDQVAFRQDFPAWRLTRTERDQGILDALMFGERPLVVSRQHGISPGRLSQLRKNFYKDWSRFCADPDDTIDTGI